MALKILQSGSNPLGQFDGLDGYATTLKGGEVVTLTSVRSGSAYDLAAADVFDGYVHSFRRAVVTNVVAAAARPLFLADEGISGYGTLFGSVVGGTVGQLTTGAVLGPHTATGSGKVTLWDKPGLYAVSLDAVDAVSLDPASASLGTGDALTFTPNNMAGGLLTKVGSSAAAGNTTVVGRFVEFSTNGSLVTTPNKFVSSLATTTYGFVVFTFNPPSA